MCVQSCDPVPLGEYLEKIIPLVVKFCNVDDDELREYCIQAFESFVRRSNAVILASVLSVEAFL